MDNIRVLIVDRRRHMPDLLREIVSKLISAQNDMEAVSVDLAIDDLDDLLDSNASAVVVVHLENGELPEEMLGLFETRSNLKIIGVSSDGRRGSVFELQPNTIPLGEMSARVLVDAIHAAARGQPAVDARGAKARNP